MLPGTNVVDSSGNGPHEGKGGARIGRVARVQVIAGGDSDVYFRFGNYAVAATLGTSADDERIQEGAVEEFNIPVDATHVSLLTVTGSATVTVDVGSNR